MDDLKNEFVIEKFKIGETIFTEGHAGDCAYLVKSGVVKIYRLVHGTK